jgi:WXG100 family type VII secretion target
MLAHLTSLESTWRGGAATAFADVLQQWRGAQLHVEQALDVITAALAQAADQYETAEQNAARLFVR